MQATDSSSSDDTLRPGGWGLTRLGRFRIFESMRYPNYCLMLLGQAGSSAGYWMDEVTRGWLIYELTNSPLQLGGVSVARALPMLVLTVIAGVVADRYGRKAQLVIAQATNLVLNLILAALVLTHLVQPWHVYATALLAGIVQAFQQPARQAMVPDIVGKQHLGNAIGLNSLVLNLSRSVGPALAGGLIALVGPGGSYLLQGGAYALSTLWTMQIQDPPQVPAESRSPASAAAHAATPSPAAASPSPASHPSVWNSTVEGARYIWSDPTIRAVILIVLAPALLGQPFTSLMPVFAKDVLAVGPTGQGFLFTAAGLGALGGAIAVAVVGGRGRQGPWMLAGALLYGATIIGFAASPWFGLSLLLMAINGLSGVSYSTQATTILQLQTPADLRGRVMGIYMLNRGLVPLGSFLAGALAAVIGAPWTVGLLGIACTLLVFGVFISVPHLRTV